MQFDTDGDGLIENGGFPDQTYDTWWVFCSHGSHENYGYCAVVARLFAHFITYVILLLLCIFGRIESQRSFDW